MNNRNHPRSTPKAAALALIALAAASCAAQDSSSAAPQKIILVPGQGHVMVLSDLNPPPTTYALTGEQTQSSQSARAWQKQSGPVYRFGNGSITLATN
jgi:hypothetical protein